MKEEQSNFLSLFIRWLSIAKVICEHFKSALGSSDFGKVALEEGWPMIDMRERWERQQQRLALREISDDPTISQGGCLPNPPPPPCNQNHQSLHHDSCCCCRVH